MQLKLGIDDWLVECARALRGEIHVAVNRETAGLKLGNVAEIKVLPGKIEMEFLVRKIVAGQTGDFGAVLGSLNVPEFGFTVDEADVASKEGHRLAIDCGVHELDVALSMRIQFRTEGVQDQIG